MLALALTLPFAAAYFAAYPGFDTTPPWIAALTDALGGLITFNRPEAVYAFYGRLYNLVYLLALPALWRLHQLHLGHGGRLERWSFGLLLAATLVTAAGVAGDYWADGAGFVLELLGLVTLWIAAGLYGMVVRRIAVVPAYAAALLMLVGPLGIVGMLITGHIPSGPSLGFALAMLGIGRLLWREGRKPEARPVGLAR